MGKCDLDGECSAEGGCAARGLAIGVLVLGALLAFGCLCCARHKALRNHE